MGVEYAVFGGIGVVIVGIFLFLCRATLKAVTTAAKNIAPPPLTDPSPTLVGLEERQTKLERGMAALELDYRTKLSKAAGLWSRTKAAETRMLDGDEDLLDPDELNTVRASIAATSVPAIPGGTPSNGAPGPPVAANPKVIGP